MLGYVTAGVKNLDASITFNTSLMTRFGMKISFLDAPAVAFGDPTDKTKARFIICKPFNGLASTAGNGTMVLCRSL